MCNRTTKTKIQNHIIDPNRKNDFYAIPVQHRFRLHHCAINCVLSTSNIGMYLFDFNVHGFELLVVNNNYFVAQVL